MNKASKNKQIKLTTIKINNQITIKPNTNPTPNNPTHNHIPHLPPNPNSPTHSPPTSAHNTSPHPLP